MRNEYLIGFYRYSDKLMQTRQFLKLKHLRSERNVINFEDMQGHTYFYHKDILKDRTALSKLESEFNFELRGFKCKLVKKNKQLKLLYFDPKKYMYSRKGKPVLKRSKLQEETNCNIIL